MKHFNEVVARTKSQLLEIASQFMVTYQIRAY